MYEGSCNVLLAAAALAAGDIPTAHNASTAAWELLAVVPRWAERWVYLMGDVALARGDVDEARRWADEAVSMTTGWHLSAALTTRARVAIARGAPEQAKQDLHDALAHAADVKAQLGVPDILESLAALAGDVDSHQEAARLLGAADAIRRRTGEVRFKTYQAAYDTALVSTRTALGQNDFDERWSEGAALSIDEAIAYTQRGRGERKRPASGWASLTPSELDVVRLVTEGLANKDIATRLFVSPRTVQTHLTHVYTKLGLTSRLQLAQEASRRA